MVFSSPVFLLYFLPLLMGLYFICPKLGYRNGVLLVFSLIFYAWGEPKWILCMLGSTLINYLCALGLNKVQKAGSKRCILILGVVASLGALFYFKYAAFLLNSLFSLFNKTAPLANLPLPIGISFYTFQILTYTVDVFRGRVGVQKNFCKLLLYVCCFPQLIAGPIVQYQDIACQLDERQSTLSDFSEGMGRFSVGLAKKVLIANLCGKMVEELLSQGQDMSVLAAWLGAIGYTLQLYFDFSAYSDMAIGLGRVLGFHYKENFIYPFIATDISDFWRRWHVSLGAFFREYVYIPLGGNRVGKGKQIRNLMIVWGLTGFWHGASWNFLLWGLYHGLLILTERFLLKDILKRIPLLFRRIVTFLLVVIGFMLFYHVDMKGFVLQLTAMFQPGRAVADESFLQILKSYSVLPLLAGVCSLPVVPWVKAWADKRDTRKKIAYIFGLAVQTGLLLLSLAFLVGQSYNPFIYFRF